MTDKYVILRNSRGEETTFPASKVFCECLQCECSNCDDCLLKECRCCAHNFSDEIAGRDRTQNHNAQPELRPSKTGDSFF
jgi:hypothetical protein